MPRCDVMADRLLYRSPMTNVWIRHIRRKAVWGPKRTLAAFCVLFVTGLAVSPADAKSPHGKVAKKVPSAPGAFAKNYKLDDELNERTKHGNSRSTTRVIVTLVPGATLPAEFKRYALNSRLDLIN